MDDDALKMAELTMEFLASGDEAIEDFLWEWITLLQQYLYEHGHTVEDFREWKEAYLKRGYH